MSEDDFANNINTFSASQDFLPSCYKMELEQETLKESKNPSVKNYASAATGLIYSKRSMTVKLKFLMENFMKIEQVEAYSGKLCVKL